MSLVREPDGWLRFGAGRRWRCVAPRYLCEVDDEGRVPDYRKLPGVADKLRRIKAFYAGRLTFGVLDGCGTGLDILAANSLAESLGSVPSPLSTRELRAVYDAGAGTDPGARLDGVIRHVADQARYLERREPGYVTPTATPGRVSVGAHHVLISTALTLTGGSGAAPQREGRITDLVCRLPAESLYAASLAIAYFNRSYALHLNQPPLLAATYNAGSPRPDPGNAWNLRQYGNHLDRWVAYYNSSRLTP